MRNPKMLIWFVVNVVAGIIALFLILKVDVTWTGSLGDTFGGMISPVIGVASIYFLYKTFEAQREQLEDQRRANRYTVSSYNLALLQNYLQDLQRRMDSLVYIKPLIDLNASGTDTIRQFQNNNFHDGYTIINSLDKSDMELIKNLAHIVTELGFLWGRYKTSVSLFTEEDKIIFGRQFHTFASFYITDIDSQGFLIKPFAESKTESAL